VRAALAGAPIDVVVQRAAGRRKALFLADMDSTMIGQECIDELADHVGVKGHVAAITERAMRGEIEFAPALRERVALLKGLRASAVDEVIDQRIRLTPGARTLIATLRKNGTYTLPRDRRLHAVHAAHRGPSSGSTRTAPTRSLSMPNTA